MHFDLIKKVAKTEQFCSRVLKIRHIYTHTTNNSEIELYKIVMR
jgi:hypothetical protein